MQLTWESRKLKVIDPPSMVRDHMAEDRSLSRGAFEWRQVSPGQRCYELYSGDERSASLCFSKAIGTLAEAEFEGGKYSFKRVGFLHPKVSIRKSPYDEDLGRVQLSWGGSGLVELVDGRRYGFHRISFWKNRWAFTDEQGDQLLTIQMRSLLVRRDGEAVIEEKGRDDPHLSMLMVLGWYMIVEMAEEGELAAVAAASSPH